MCTARPAGGRASTDRTESSAEPARSYNPAAAGVVLAPRIRRGVGRWPALRADGVSVRAIQRGVREGLVLQAGRGGYVLPDADPALIAAVAINGVVSHLSAARLHGLDLYQQPKTIDITVPR